MNFLAIDTVSEMSSVAVKRGDTIFKETVHTPQSHTMHILPQVKRVLAEAELSLKEIDCITFDRGPGAFTGLRIGAGITQGLALSHDISVVSVSSLQALAQQAYRQWGATKVLACMDARQQEVYWAYYILDSGLMKLVGSEAIGSANTVSLSANEAVMGVGSGFIEFKTELSESNLVTYSSIEADCIPNAVDLFAFAEDAYNNGLQHAAELATPVYLRDNVVRHVPKVTQK